MLAYTVVMFAMLCAVAHTVHCLEGILFFFFPDCFVFRCMQISKVVLLLANLKISTEAFLLFFSIEIF